MSARRQVTAEAVVLRSDSHRRGKVPIRCEKCQVDPEMMSRSIRHSSVSGRHGKPLKENSPRRRHMLIHKPHGTCARKTQNNFQDAEVRGKCHSVSHRVDMQTFSSRSVNFGISLVV